MNSLHRDATIPEWKWISYDAWWGHDNFVSYRICVLLIGANFPDVIAVPRSSLFFGRFYLLPDNGLLLILFSVKVCSVRKACPPNNFPEKEMSETEVRSCLTEMGQLFFLYRSPPFMKVNTSVYFKAFHNHCYINIIPPSQFQIMLINKKDSHLDLQLARQ